MRFAKNIINLIYSGYCIALFFIVLILTIIVYIPLIAMTDKSRTIAGHRVNKFFSWLWLTACGYRVSIEGAEKIDPNKTYMFVCNHVNMLDLPVTGYFLQHYYKSLAKKELKYVPMFGIVLLITSILVDRSSAESRRRSTQIIIDKLKNGVSFFIFPEGTRNTTSKPLKSFYSGAFKTAVIAEAPILPFVYLNHRNLQPVGTMRFYPGRIHIKVFDAIETKGVSREQIGELQERVYKLMENAVVNEDKSYKRVD